MRPSHFNWVICNNDPCRDQFFAIPAVLCQALQEQNPDSAAEGTDGPKTGSS